MKKYLGLHEWQIIEDGFHAVNNKVSESIFSLGNGYFGQRGNFEESFSGSSLRGNYIAGVYYPDKTRVGWWKNGYPEYFAKVLNAPEWTCIDVTVDGEKIDLASVEIKSFRRILDMKKGTLSRECVVVLKNGAEVMITSLRFISMYEKNTAAIKYNVKLLNKNAEVSVSAYIDAEVTNEDSNYNESFWNIIEKNVSSEKGFVIAETKKTESSVCTAMKTVFNGNISKYKTKSSSDGNKIFLQYDLSCKKNDEISVIKYVAVISSRYYEKKDMVSVANNVLDDSSEKGFENILNEHIACWEKKWERCDIEIEGDVGAQQGIRFNIFQLYQTYNGADERLNIGPKGFTGEKYGGSTYWDTEAFCFPFYMCADSEQTAYNLLMYRYRQLGKAIENAEKLGIKGGAALYPMVTINGEECHNEWEITFEEIHRNGAIAYAIYDFLRYTGRNDYLVEYGIEVLIAISRFWAQRVQYSTEKRKYVILGVTGPNEYENNVNNNWYTNCIASWTLKYTIESLAFIKGNNPSRYEKLISDTSFDDVNEINLWNDIIKKMFFPYDENKRIILQQEGFLDKELLPVSDIPEDELPINQNWSWDRILRSCYIKQADVLQGMFFFEDHFAEECIRRNFDFYEPMTVHESSLSSSIHSVIASRIGYHDKAYSLYLRAARLDLDDYNNDTEDGCHITSMAGSWLAVVYGFAGLKIENNMLSFSPFIPAKWKSYSFRINFRGNMLLVKVNANEVTISNLNNTQGTDLIIFEKKYMVKMGESKIIKLK